MLSSFLGIYPSDARRTPPPLPCAHQAMEAVSRPHQCPLGSGTAPCWGQRLCNNQGAPSSQKWVQTPDWKLLFWDLEALAGSPSSPQPVLQIKEGRRVTEGYVTGGGAMISRFT